MGYKPVGSIDNQVLIAPGLTAYSEVVGDNNYKVGFTLTKDGMTVEASHMGADNPHQIVAQAISKLIENYRIKEYENLEPLEINNDIMIL